MRTVAVLAGFVGSNPVWLWCRMKADGTGFDRITVTTPGGLSTLDVDPEDETVDWSRVSYLFDGAVRQAVIDDGG